MQSYNVNAFIYNVETVVILSEIFSKIFIVNLHFNLLFIHFNSIFTYFNGIVSINYNIIV